MDREHEIGPGVVADVDAGLELVELVDHVAPVGVDDAVAVDILGDVTVAVDVGEGRVDLRVGLPRQDDADAPRLKPVAQRQRDIEHQILFHEQDLGAVVAFADVAEVDAAVADVDADRWGYLL